MGLRRATAVQPQSCENPHDPLKAETWLQRDLSPLTQTPAHRLPSLWFSGPGVT